MRAEMPAKELHTALRHPNGTGMEQGANAAVQPQADAQFYPTHPFEAPIIDHAPAQVSAFYF